MNKTDQNKIIVALATPYGKSAIAAIRISGSGCIEKTEEFLKKPLKIGKLQYNTFINGEFTENLMAVCFKSPNSYTGEDTVEIYPHGNMTVCDFIISALINSGMSIAERGEFTKRAFLNGKLNLMQCEALADIIDAQTSAQLIYGNKRFDGGFKSLAKVENMLNTALSTVEAVLHYGDELEENEIDNGLVNDVYGAIDKISQLLKQEIDAYNGGRITNEGLKIAIVGEPNVGKSTLLNALTDSDRAIVTDIAGTTRDTIDATYIYKGKVFRIIDTAGITETDDVVEKIGVERAKAAAKSADVVLYVTDSTKKEEITVDSKTVITIINKCDTANDVGENYKSAEKNGVLSISAKNGINITALKQKLYDIYPKESGEICNHRQYECLVKCYDACRAAKSESEKAEGLELTAAALSEAYTAIEELYGEKADDKILDSVFERFCVGK